MNTLHQRLSSAFMIMQSHIKIGSDARAFQMLENIVKSEVKKAKAKVKNNG